MLEVWGLTSPELADSKREGLGTPPVRRQVPVIGLILRSKKDSEGKPDLEIP